MPSAHSLVQYIHDASCETALLADCHCFCHGAGHQNDLVIRAASCSNSSDYSILLANLGNIFGGFHQTVRDVATPTRRARDVPTGAAIPSLRLNVGKGATWFETLMVDEALHAVFIEVATDSMGASQVVREAQVKFVDAITHGAISVIGSPVALTNVVESHVWCSIVAEYLASLTPPGPGMPTPQGFADISYPRKSASQSPTALPSVRTAGLTHLAAAYTSTVARSIPQMQRDALIRRVGAATCPDLWHHAAAVRYCLVPFVSAPTWAPPATTKIVTMTELGKVTRRWRRKGHWRF
jgi:hypothetical protein